MKIQFLGATDTVTGSKYLVREGDASVLVDCGLFQGYKQLRLRNWEPPPVAPASVGAVILTHAHIDHSGYLPLLAREGFAGKVYCTQATYDLCRILLPDCGWLMEEEAEYANRHGFSRHAPARPLFTQADAERCLRLFSPMPYGKEWSPAAGLTASLRPSGHMPGSSFVTIDNGRRSILFSGDIGRPHDLVLKPPAQMDGADYLVVESTYGDRLHESTDALAQLGDVIRRTSARGGVVLIPAFAVGRTQSLLYALHLLASKGEIPHLPIYLNSPMASAATQAYERHRDELRLSAAECKAMTHAAHIVESVAESQRLNSRHGPMIIISASGMATGGRVVHHIKAFAPDHRNTLLFAGYQAGGTRGASIVGGARTVRIHGEDVRIRAEVASLGPLSAHADAAEIEAWLRGFKVQPRTTFITHGEPASADALRQRIERALHWNCHMPYYTETVELA